MKSKLGDALSERREYVGYATQTDLIAALGKVLGDTSHPRFSQSWLSRLERDKSGEIIAGARMPMLRALAYTLRWSVSELQEATGVDLGMPGGDKDLDPAHAHADAHPIETDLELIPVYGLAAAGPGVYNEDREAIGYMYVAREFARHPNRVTFMVEGESMAPTIEHGDAVHVDRSDTDLHNEKVFLVEVLGNGYVVKRAREYGPDDWELVSDNPKFKALRPTEARVMGRVFGVSPQMRKL